MKSGFCKRWIGVVCGVIGFVVVVFFAAKISHPKFQPQHEALPNEKQEGAKSRGLQKGSHDLKTGHSAFLEDKAAPPEPNAVPSSPDQQQRDEHDSFDQIGQLKRDGSPSAVQKLAQLLTHPDTQVQVEALAAIRDLHAVGALAAVSLLAQSTTDPLVLRGVSMALGSIGAAAARDDERAAVTASLKRLFEELEIRNDPQASGHRYTIVGALGEVKHQDSVAFLQEKLTAYDNDPVMQAALVRALAKIGDPASLPALVKLQKNLESKPDPQSSRHLQLAYADLKSLVEATKRQLTTTPSKNSR